MKQCSIHELAKMIDHSLLHPALTDKDILIGCELARSWDTATVCVKPYAIETAVHALEGSDVAVCTVSAFPHGNTSINMKVAESADSARRGAEEVDMVVNIGKVLSLEWAYIEEEISRVNEAVMAEGALLKVIFENDFLEDEHIIQLSRIGSKAEVAFLKTSTGFGFKKHSDGTYQYKGALDEHLKLMLENAGDGVQVKGAGALRTLDDLLRVRELGVTRIGATATEAILSEARLRGFPE